MSVEQTFYRIVVVNNLVVAVEPADAAEGALVATTPLEVSSQLASNHQTRGSMDGVYVVPDAEMARQVANLSLDFMAKVVERSIVSLSEATLRPAGWQNPFAAKHQR